MNHLSFIPFFFFFGLSNYCSFYEKFQEVDRFHDLELELKPWGYDGIWKVNC